jgi:hypothetical protein
MTTISAELATKFLRDMYRTRETRTTTEAQLFSFFNAHCSLDRDGSVYVQPQGARAYWPSEERLVAFVTKLLDDDAAAEEAREEEEDARWEARMHREEEARLS